jgi:hypothetical protein
VDLAVQGEDLGVFGPVTSAAAAASPARWSRRGTPVAIARRGIIAQLAARRRSDAAWNVELGQDSFVVIKVPPTRADGIVGTRTAGLESERIAVRMSQRTRKARNVARDLRVAISVTDRNQPHTAAVVRGTSANPTRPAACELLEEMSAECVGSRQRLS